MSAIAFLLLTASCLADPATSASARVYDGCGAGACTLTVVGSVNSCYVTPFSSREDLTDYMESHYVKGYLVVAVEGPVQEVAQKDLPRYSFKMAPRKETGK